MKRVIFIAVCVLIALPCSVRGVPHIPEIELTWNGGSSWLSEYTEDDVMEMGGCKYGLNDTLTSDDGVFTAYWGLTFSPDPDVVAVWGIINLSDETQTFTYTATAPVDPPITTNTMYGGSMSGSFSANGQGGTLSTAGSDPLYYGLIDSVGVLELYPATSSWTIEEYESITIPAVSDGLPGPSLPYGPVSTDIGIQFKFTLTPGEAASFNGNFVVTPEPATICLLGFGALCLIRKRRT